MMKSVQKKLQSRAGESITETLIALLISSLALVMLAGAISTTWNLVDRSDNTLKAYYEANTALESGNGGDAWSGTVTIKTADNTAVRLVENTESLNVSGAVNGVLGGRPVAAYRKTGS